MFYICKCLRNNEEKFLEMYNLPDNIFEKIKEIEDTYSIEFSEIEKEYLLSYINKCCVTFLSNQVSDIFLPKGFEDKKKIGKKRFIEQNRKRAFELIEDLNSCPTEEGKKLIKQLVDFYSKTHNYFNLEKTKPEGITVFKNEIRKFLGRTKNQLSRNDIKDIIDFYIFDEKN